MFEMDGIRITVACSEEMLRIHLAKALGELMYYT